MMIVRFDIHFDGEEVYHLGVEMTEKSHEGDLGFVVLDGENCFSQTKGFLFYFYENMYYINDFQWLKDFYVFLLDSCIILVITKI